MEAQTVFAILVGIALACFSLVIVGYSFFRGTDARRVETGAPAPDDDGVGLDAILDSIDTLELEYQLGNVTEEQYHQQLQSYRLQVAMMVKAQLERGDASRELVLEQEVLRARGTGTGGWRPCPQCDAPLPESTAAGGQVAACPHCDASLSDGRSQPSRDARDTALPAQAE